MTRATSKSLLYLCRMKIMTRIYGNAPIFIDAGLMRIPVNLTHGAS
ncbi:MAG: hypothetical protein ACREPB_02780 [Arenimonas sp.]